MSEQRRAFDDDYQEFERKMLLFEEGPTTTDFDKLVAAGVHLPEPAAVNDAGIRTKLWEVLAQLAKLRVYLDNTDHLNDRELYTKLWQDVLRVETPAIDEIGFNTCVSCCQVGTADETLLYLKHYADDFFREQCLKDYPDQEVPPHEDPPYNRDVLLPRPHYEVGPEATEWLKANWNPSALASNRFGPSRNAMRFVDDLYAAGATRVTIDNIMRLPNHDWTPYADTLVVELPKDPETRRALFDLMKDVGQPDEDGGKTVEQMLTDCGQASMRLWWD